MYLVTGPSSERAFPCNNEIKKVGIRHGSKKYRTLLTKRGMCLAVNWEMSIAFPLTTGPELC
jgi:FlaA1/EpsC-like NDP-sugar epimerase